MPGAEYPPIEVGIESYDRESAQQRVEKAEEQRREVLERFPRAAWEHLPLERYALGLEGEDPTYSYLLEYGTQELGSIRGGSAHKHIVYKHRDKPGWYFSSEYSDEQEAWSAFRSEIVDMLSMAEEGDWGSITVQTAPVVMQKTLHIYFPAEVLAVYSTPHLRHFLKLVGHEAADDSTADALQLNRALLSALRDMESLAGWSSNELMFFLYEWADPRGRRRIVKIAPGRDAAYWEECLEGGYICVGWDDVGDLTAFETKEAFRERFGELHDYDGNEAQVTRKSNEMWKLLELEPGDVVVANHGIAKILAIGTVVEPGYEWRPDRPEMKHTVRVDWDTSYAREIDPIKRWGMVTVADVPLSLYERIIDGKNGARVPVPNLFEELASALARKGQAILYGPPGTGKTYLARHFALWWLLRGTGREEDARAALIEPKRFARLERELSISQVRRRVWWVVANPSEWNWDRLFQSGSVDYRYGRIRKNYALAQPGDLVIGYQASPDKRVVALARIAGGLEKRGGDEEPTILLEPLTKVQNGLTYLELENDPVLKDSEPIRNRNQGTLFSLTPEEAEYLLAAMTERDPSLREHLETGEAIAPFSFLTFHQSYSYEDFVEGYRPTETAGGSLSLRLTDGVFKRLCQEAQANSERSYLLLIDEVNRANIAKVFGELITLLEKDKRGLVVTLPQSQENFMIPPNLYILGTMNTADRSIRLLDAALRRRFAFVELMPDVSLLAGARIGTLQLDQFLQELNSRIARAEGREKQIGHSFLLEDGEPIADPDEFARRFRQEVLPLLQEYCYADYSALSQYLGSKLVDEEAQSLDHERLTNAELLLEALTAEFSGKASQPG